MKKVIRLTESDLTKIIRRVIREQENEVEIEDVLNSPKVEKAAEEVVNQMSSKDLQDLKRAFSMLGVSPTSSFGEVKSAVENIQQDMNDTNELQEDEKMSPKKKMWLNVRAALFMLGVGNAALYFTPFSALFDKLLDLYPTNQASFEWSGILSLLLIVIGGDAILGSDKKQENK